MVLPTVTALGAVFSRGVLDNAASALTQVKQEFGIPASTDSVLGVLIERLRFMRSRLFLLLDSAKVRLDLHRAELGKVSQQLANGTERYDDLPQPAHPFKYLGPTEDVDRIRQKILDERARLLEEQRRLEERYWSDIQDLKAQAAEVLAEYVGLAGRVEAITRDSVPVPALCDVFAFLVAPEPEEVVILADTPTVAPPAERLP